MNVRSCFSDGSKIARNAANGIDAVLLHDSTP